MSDYGRAKNVDYNKSYEKLKRRVLFENPIVARYDAAVRSLERVHRNFQKNLTNVFEGSTGVFECINSALVVLDYFEATGDKEREGLRLPLAGAMIELGSYLTKFASARALDAIVKRGLLNANAVLSIATAIVDCAQADRDIVSAVEQENTAKLVGSEIVVVGSAISLVGFAIAMIEGFSVSAALTGTLPGLVVAAIGGLVVLVGKIIVALSERNPYEEFAAYSSFGVAHKAEKIFPRWSPHALPCQTAKDEVDVLVTLLSQFSVECVVADGSVRINVNPGMLQDGALFEVHASIEWSPFRHSRLMVNYDLSSGEHVVVDAKGTEVWVGSYCTVSAEGLVRQLSIKVDDIEERGRDTPLSTVNYVPHFNKVWVRLTHGEGIRIPIGGRWLELESKSYLASNHHAGAGKTIIVNPVTTANTFDARLADSSF